MFFATKKENKGENNVCRFGLCFSLFPTKKENEGGNNFSRGHVFLCFLHKKENKRGRMLVGGQRQVADVGQTL